MEKIVVAKCVVCGTTKDVESGEIIKGEVPMCDNCMSPMVAEKAIVKE